MPQETSNFLIEKFPCMNDVSFLPTLHRRLLADCLHDVADGELVRIGPAMQRTNNRASLPYWRRRGCLTWVDAAHALQLIGLQRPTEGWILEPGLRPDIRLGIGTAIFDHCARHAIPPLVCMPRLFHDPDDAAAEAFLAAMARKADRHGWQVASPRIVDSAGFALSYATHAAWSGALTARLAIWQRLGRNDAPVLI